MRSVASAAGAGAGAGGAACAAQANLEAQPRPRPRPRPAPPHPTAPLPPAPSPRPTCSTSLQPLLRPKFSGRSSSYWMEALRPPSLAPALYVPASWNTSRKATGAWVVGRAGWDGGRPGEVVRRGRGGEGGRGWEGVSMSGVSGVREGPGPGACRECGKLGVGGQGTKGAWRMEAAGGGRSSGRVGRASRLPRAGQGTGTGGLAAGCRGVWGACSQSVARTRTHHDGHPC